MIYSGNQRASRSLLASGVFIATVLVVYILRTSPTNISQPDWRTLDAALTPHEIEENKPERIALVVASQTTDNMTWLDGSFPSWEKSIYLTDAPSDLSVPANKGRESMVYLTYVLLLASSMLVLTHAKLHHRQLRKPAIIHDLPTCQQISMAQ